MASLIRRAVGQWTKDNGSFLAAALAFRVMLALSPLLIVLLAAGDALFRDGRVEGGLLIALTNVIGPAAAQLLHDLIAGAHRSGAGPFASAIGLLLTLVTASSVIQQMKFALNAIWKVPSGVMTLRSIVFGRFHSLVVLVSLAIIMLLWLVLDASVAVLGRTLQGVTLGPLALWPALAFLASVVVNSVLFALFYRIIPDTPIRWSDVIFGAIVAAILFSVGKLILGFYFDLSGVLQAYGAAGSLVALLLWLYYSGQIFLLGAEITVKYAHTHGSRAAAPMQQVLPT